MSAITTGIAFGLTFASAFLLGMNRGMKRAARIVLSHAEIHRRSAMSWQALMGAHGDIENRRDR